MPGTAPHRPVWALLEHPGPWGRDAVLDAPWPVPGLGARLSAATEEAGVRLLLARRPRRRGGDVTVIDHADATAPRHVVLARTGPGGWIAGRTVPTSALADLDWAEAARSDGVPEGWTSGGAVWGVCTHGTRDACCARLGRPLAQAFQEAAPGAVWEISHTGGHRFAGVALALPSGLMHGRVGPQDARGLVEALADGRVVSALLRGEVQRPPADQVALAALREHLHEDRLEAFVAVEGGWEHRAPNGATTRWQVEVTSTPGPVRPASCQAEPTASTVLQAGSVRPFG